MVDFSSIIWPQGLSGLNLEAQSELISQIPQRDRGYRETEEVSSVCVRALAPRSGGYTLERVVLECLPKAPGNNHRCLFDLNRGILTLELQERSTWDITKRRQAFDLWYSQAHVTGFLRSTQTKEEYLFEFMGSNSNIRVPLGSDGLSEALEKVKTSDPPPEAANFEHPKMKLAISLCYQLQLASGKEPFFLAARSLGEVIEMDWSGCAKWLKALCIMGVLQLVEQGGTEKGPRKASRYRYVSLSK